MVTKPRSPNYPGIDLRVAVDRAKQLYPKVQRGAFTPLDAAQAWGYSGDSSAMRRATGALRQYGLIEAKKGDNARLTTRALTLALREPESREFRTALREAVVSPALFEELIDSGRANNATGALRQYLVVEKRFTKEGADTFIGVFKTSIAFAGLDDGDDTAWLDEGVTDEHGQAITTTAPATTPPPSAPVPPPGSLTIPIPLNNGGMGTVTLPVGMTPADWNRLDAILSAYKSSLNEPVLYSASETSRRAGDEADAE